MAYLDGELPAKEATAAMTHLQHCRDCQEIAADLQSVSRRLSAWQVEERSPALTECLGAALNAPSWRKKKTLNWSSFLAEHQRRLSVVAAIVLLIAVPTVFLRRSAIRRSHESSTTYLAAYKGRQGAASEQLSVGVVDGNPIPDQAVTPSGPLITRTARLSLTTGDFPHIRESISRVLATRNGYIAQLEMNTPVGEARSLDATLRIPAAQLDAALLDLKRLGHVDAESQRGEEVTQRVIDVGARLSNLRVTEARLTDMLRQRTGKLGDVLAVEEQIDSIRGHIETVEAEQKSLNGQIAFAAVQLRVREEYKKPLALNNTSLSTRLSNAAVEGFQILADGAIELLLFLLSYGPTLLIVAALLFYPVRKLWKHRQKRYSVL